MTTCDKCQEQADHVVIQVIVGATTHSHHIDLCKQCQIELAVDLKDFTGKKDIPRFAPMKAGGLRL